MDPTWMNKWTRRTIVDIIKWLIQFLLVLLIFFTLSYIFSFTFTGPGGWSQPKNGMGECVQCGQGQYQQDIEQTEWFVTARKICITKMKQKIKMIMLSVSTALLELTVPVMECYLKNYLHYQVIGDQQKIFLKLIQDKNTDNFLLMYILLAYFRIIFLS